MQYAIAALLPYIVATALVAVTAISLRATVQVLPYIGISLSAVLGLHSLIEFGADLVGFTKPVGFFNEVRDPGALVRVATQTWTTEWLVTSALLAVLGYAPLLWIRGLLTRGRTV